jgi:RNA ligase
MNFYDYIGMDPTVFLAKYLEAGLVQRGTHDTFPLDMYTYTRQTVYENNWDSVTSKCRGIIVNRDTLEIIARPFEKFHNYGAVVGYYAGAGGPTAAGALGEPVIWEKMDGFLCTAYPWDGRNYIASKGSFHSPHAKWATAEFNRAIVKKGYSVDGGPLREGHTLVFEGLNKDLRIVVDYGKRQELVLLAVINNETGEELEPEKLREFAKSAGFSLPLQNNLTLAEATRRTLRDQPEGEPQEEGFVATWYRDGQPPFRLKIKYVEYLRLHRLVTGMSPKNIWETLSQGLDVSEYVNNSTPWFKAWFEKWQRAFMVEYSRIDFAGRRLYNAAQDYVARVYPLGYNTLNELKDARKVFADYVNVQNKEYAGVAFAILDGKQVAPIIWKKVKRLAKNAHTLRDATQ